MEALYKKKTYWEIFLMKNVDFAIIVLSNVMTSAAREWLFSFGNDVFSSKSYLLAD